MKASEMVTDVGLAILAQPATRVMYLPPARPVPELTPPTEQMQAQPMTVCLRKVPGGRCILLAGHTPSACLPAPADRLAR